MQTGSSAADLLSSSLLQQHLLHRLSLPDLFSLEDCSTAFRQLLDSAPDALWQQALARFLPPSHPAAQVETGCRQLAHQYAAVQRAIKSKNLSPGCVAASTEAHAARITSMAATR